ncbi:hypothetical protein ATCC90586_002798 [Pythium insidiosum]|nr:hypothetical protein ATCC90586_002798 [Pythium insidiosum]
MHITLRLEEDDEDLLLASLRFYPHSGLLCVTPGFSVVFDDPSGDAALAPILSTFEVTSRVSGERFEFALDNESDLLPMVAVEDAELLRVLQREETQQDLNQLQEWNAKHGDTSTNGLRVKDLANRPDRQVRDQVPSAEQQFEDYFLGADELTIAPSGFGTEASRLGGSICSRFGLETRSTGARIRIRVEATGVVKRSVDEILRASPLGQPFTTSSLD